MHSRIAVAVGIVFVSLLPAPGQTVGPEGTSKGSSFTEKWVFISHNFANEKNCDEVIAVLDRAAKAGYNGMAVTDCKFFRWNEVKEEEYAANLARVRRAARDRNIKIYAFCCSQHTDLLSNDVNLAEGQPVVGAPFLARGGKLVPIDDDLQIVNGSFEEVDNGRPKGWKVNGGNAAVDTTVQSQGRSSVRVKAATQLSQKIKLVPNRYYRLKMRIKSEEIEPAYQFNVYLSSSDNTRLLCYKPFGIAKTQDWKEHSWEFNTMDVPEMMITFGIWGEYPGTVWVDEMTIEPGALVNLIRRDGCPFKMTSADGKTVYVEGKDFEGARDPLLGRANNILGVYDYWHRPPVMTLPAGSRIREGQKVLVSYAHAVTIYGWSTFPCLNEPAIWPLLEKHLAWVHKLLKPDGYILSHDEIRHYGWDASCRKVGKEPAELLAENIHRCVALVHKEDPGKPIYIWNDMIDPNMNAAKTGYYYFVNGGPGPWYGSWKGLDKDLIILNWNHFPNEKRKRSLRFFEQLGHKQILAGYYDQSPKMMTPWLQEAAGVKGVIGVMYTTWVRRFDDLDEFIKTVERFAQGTIEHRRD